MTVVVNERLKTVLRVKGPRTAVNRMYFHGEHGHLFRNPRNALKRVKEQNFTKPLTSDRLVHRKLPDQGRGKGISRQLSTALVG